MQIKRKLFLFHQLVGWACAELKSMKNLVSKQIENREWQYLHNDICRNRQRLENSDALFEVRTLNRLRDAVAMSWIIYDFPTSINANFRENLHKNVSFSFSGCIRFL